MKPKIFAICNDLQQQGIKPTLERVRNALGGGSFSSINPILKEWKEQQGGAGYVPQELPQEALQAINHAATVIWSLASAKSADNIRLLHADFESRLADISIERDEALGEVARLEQELAKITADGQRREKEANSLTLQVQKQQLSLDELIKQNQELKADLKAVKTELKEANNDAAMLRGQLSVYQSQSNQSKAAVPSKKKPVINKLDNAV